MVHLIPLPLCKEWKEYHPMSDTTDRDRRRSDDEPSPQRRSSDVEGADTATEPVSFRDRLRRWRRPLIGLGIAGASLPMVQATTASPAAQPAREDAADPETAAAAEGDVEEKIVDKIAVSREEQERTRHVEEAVRKYDISRELAEDIYDIAREQNLDPKMAYGLVNSESTFDKRAVSHVGARGLTQVMPRTARWLMPGTKTEELYDRQTNLRLGFKYLDQLIDKYRGDVRLALLAYNRGPGTVDRVLKRGGNPDNGYADKVLRG